jgi:hypothetical protein
MLLQLSTGVRGNTINPNEPCQLSKDLVSEFQWSAELLGSQQFEYCVS